MDGHAASAHDPSNEEKATVLHDHPFLSDVELDAAHTLNHPRQRPNSPIYRHTLANLPPSSAAQQSSSSPASSNPPRQPPPPNQPHPTPNSTPAQAQTQQPTYPPSAASPPS
jgi:hypothetical protein